MLWHTFLIQHGRNAFARLDTLAGSCNPLPFGLKELVSVRTLVRIYAFRCPRNDQSCMFWNTSLIQYGRKAFARLDTLGAVILFHSDSRN